MANQAAKVHEKEVNPPAEQRQGIQSRRGQPMSPFEEMERLFESFMPRGWLGSLRRDWPEMTMPFEGRMPRVDVVDRDSDVLVRAELPGVDKKDLDVSMTDSTLTIKGSSRREEKEEKGEYYRCEITQGAFMRTVSLPATVEGDKAKASFKDGLLEVTLPKVEKAQRRSVKVE